jgi:hypothetical protein
MRDEKNNESYVELTTTEVSNIWSAYLKSSLELRFFQYFYATTKDHQIKIVVEQMLTQAQTSLHELKDLFINENLAVPIGFTEEDIKAGASKVFSDTFILYFCHDLTMLSLSTYPSALCDCTRKDIRAFFQKSIEFSLTIQNEMTELMLESGVYLKPPQVTLDHKVDFADTVNYLNGLFGASRPLNAAEIANLTRIIHRAQFSKMVFVTFSKLATTKDLKQYFSKGRDTLEKVLDLLQEVLEKENIPLSASGDYQIFDSETSPFSEKLMLYFVNACLGMFCFIMISQAMTSSLRSDIVTKLSSIFKEMKKYYGQGLLLTITEKWLEQPPQAIDRKV